MIDPQSDNQKRKSKATDFVAPAIPEDELEFQFVRSSGSGGQNVNKVATKAQITWPISDSRVFTPEQQELICQLAHARGYLTKSGNIFVSDQRTRSQDMNRAAALGKLKMLVYEALKPRKVRVATKLPRRAKEKRLSDKRINSQRKQQRRSEE